MTKELLKSGADPNSITQDGWSPVQLAVHKFSLESRHKKEQMNN
jgi:hypothetical protein